jgi:hypothetical protein
MDVILEALGIYRSQWEWWLTSLHATDAERELARIKLAMIDEVIAVLEKEQNSAV